MGKRKTRLNRRFLLLYSVAMTYAVAATVYFPEESGIGTKPSLSAQSDALGRHNAKADALMEKGLTLQNEGRIDEAIETYKKVIRESPKETYDDGIGMSGRLYSDDAREHLDVLFCRKQRGSDFSSDSPEKLVKTIRDAFLSQKADLLVSYASCAFKVGLAAPSDYVWSQSPSRVMPVIIKLGPALNWDLARFDNFGELVIKTPKDEAHVFIFEEANGRWRWVGYFTSDEEILDRLSRADRPKK